MCNYIKGIPLYRNKNEILKKENTSELITLFK